MGSNTDIGFIVPTPEQNYRSLMELASGIKSFKVVKLHQSETLPLESATKAESSPHLIDTTSEQKKIESPELIQKQVISETKESESSPTLQTIEEPNDERSPKRKEESPPKRKEEKSPKRKEESLPIRKEESPPKRKEESSPKRKEENPPKRKEPTCKIEEKVGRFPFKPFAETARAVGIPAHSSYKATSDLFTSFNGVLDSTTLLELYYFDYDRLVISRPILDDKEDAWISKSLLSLIYKSEQEDPLSFLILSYGITSTHWQSFMPEEDLETPEIVVEEPIQEHDPGHGDIIFDK